MENKHKVIAIYGYNHHVNDDGTPSRDDRRYIEENMYLSDDMSFKLIKQKGRLDPKYDSYFGEWQINENNLILHVRQRQYIDFSGEKVIEKYVNTIHFEKQLSYFINRDDNQKWGYKQGLRPERLFQTFKNKK